MRSDAFPALGSYTPRSALVIVRSPALFSQKVLLDQGTGAGIQVGDPVVSGVATKDYQGAALVGRVTAVSHDTADVTLISDPAMAVSASVAGQQGADGVLQPNAGDASTQVLDFVGKQYTVQPGNLVVTSGFSDSKLGLASFFPRGIMIGVVSTVSQSGHRDLQVDPGDAVGRPAELPHGARPHAGRRDDGRGGPRRRCSLVAAGDAARAASPCCSQITVATDLDVLGGRPDLVVIVVISIALLCGPLAGAVAGFAGGFLVDALGLGVIGATSLTLTSVGYAAGLWGERLREAAARAPAARDRRARRWRPASASWASRCWSGAGPAVSPGLVLAVVPGSMLNVLLAIALYPLIRAAACAAASRATVADRSRVGHRLMFQDSTRRRRARGARSRCSWPCASPCSAASPCCCSRCCSSGSGCCRCCRQELPDPAAAPTTRAPCGCRRRAGASSTSTATCWSATGPAIALTFDLTTDEKVTEGVRRPARRRNRQPPPEPTAAQMKKLLKGLEGQEEGARSGPRIKLSEPKPIVQVWAGCARTNDMLVRARAADPRRRSRTSRTASTSAIGRSPFEPVTC